MTAALRRPTGEQGAAVVDFVLVMVLVFPLFLGILQVGLVLHVRNTLTAAASEGARYAATVDRGPTDGVRRTREQIDAAVAADFASAVSAQPGVRDGAPGIRVQVTAEVPPLGTWGPAVRLQVSGHAVEEQP